ncbi:MAG: LysM peptidoglycan-binding domain-containing protein [Sphaerospermopsis sp. SIO1G2]|nr:LysM peptidoglycan-binding domain-containing protein [Sphaerospermopsis sp. SIO1G1]NET69935.1 LysM peptidoglycan-binding domain-containing protein [Sphaerospermopsis sp. SIO1G2]
MNIKIDCPVCGYKDIEGKHCPNCETDLSLIRSLQELPTVKKLSPLQRMSSWTLALALSMLLIGIGFGVLSSFLLMENQYASNMFTSNSTIVVNQELVTEAQEKNQNIDNNTYTVRKGDNLGVIAEKVCGRASAWRLIAAANPRLEQRRNYFIKIGEKLKIPNCQEKIQ